MPTVAAAYQLPNFLALVGKKPSGEVNPHFKEIEAEFNTWVEKKLGGRPVEGVYQSEIPLFVSMVCPLASREQSVGIAIFITVTFMVDDLQESIPSEQLEAIAQSYINILRDGQYDQSPLAKIMDSEFMFSVKAAVGSFHWPQFIDENEKLATHAVQEARDRETSMNANSALNIQSYMIKRRCTVGASVAFVFIRSTRCLCIPGDILSNPIIQEMENATADMITVANDILSYKKEYSEDGASVNLLTVMQKDPETAHLKFQERLDYSGKLFEATLERFRACRRDLPSFGPVMDQYLALYADGMIDMAIGNVEWSLVNRRYSVFANEEDRRNNVLRLVSLPRAMTTITYKL